MDNTCDHSKETREVIVHEHKFENVYTCEACGEIRKEYEYRAGGSIVIPKDDFIVWGDMMVETLLVGLSGTGIAFNQQRAFNREHCPFCIIYKNKECPICKEW